VPTQALQRFQLEFLVLEARAQKVQQRGLAVVERLQRLMSPSRSIEEIRLFDFV
jgi:hypothetical protein